MIKPGTWSPTLSRTKGLKVRLMLILFFVICCYCTQFNSRITIDFLIQCASVLHVTCAVDSRQHMIIIIWWLQVYYTAWTLLCSCPCTTSSNWFQQTWACGLQRCKHRLHRHELLTPGYRSYKVVPHSIKSIRYGADPSFLAVSLQVTLVINPVVGCHYFPPGLRLLSQPKISPPCPIPNYTVWWQYNM